MSRLSICAAPETAPTLFDSLTLGADGAHDSFGPHAQVA